MKKIRLIGIALLGAVWLTLAAFAWFGPARDSSDAERRKLAQFPELSGKTVLSGTFMTRFEEYTLDQFPLRDTFRQLKAQVHYNWFGQLDNHGIYITGDTAAQLEYPLNETSVNHALQKFNRIYDKYLKDSGGSVVFSVAPDKGYYLAEANGYPAMDYEALFDAVREGMPWAEIVDLTDLLTAEDYYRTDTHWRQERLMDVAQRLCEALGAEIPKDGDYTAEAVERPFYGVYYGQAAVPMDPDEIILLRNEILDRCTVFNHETGKTAAVYDLEKLTGRDLYDVYLSGASALLTIENPNASSDRELLVFRDSFGSSLAPLLMSEYKTVTLIDIRYIATDMLDQFVDFHGQDVLFLYSTLVLNDSGTLKS